MGSMIHAEVHLCVIHIHSSNPYVCSKQSNLKAWFACAHDVTSSAQFDRYAADVDRRLNVLATPESRTAFSQDEGSSVVLH